MNASHLLVALVGVALGAVMFGVVRSRMTGGESESTLALADSRAQRLHLLAAALSRATSPGEVAGAFLDQALEQLDAQGGSLALRSADGAALALAARGGAGAPRGRGGAPLARPAGRDLPGAEARLLGPIPIDQHLRVTAASRPGTPAFASPFEELRSPFPTSAATFGPGAQAIYA